ncbi:MAG: YqeG family HAD IIIA-type phosphatase [Bacilli bacterium]|jgi:HAD superfamily phosphatase (TIGR01668 family)|nr:YqeG family HAD IIIA-type phosphatase [Bacilli bacterium]
MSKFKPTKYYKSIFDVNFNLLKNEGIKLIACDLDNTLVPHDVALPDKRVIELFRYIKSLGFEVVILSNNKEKRVQLFSDELNIPYYYSARKPLKKAFKRLLHDYHLQASQICLIGDQILTDVYGANGMHIMNILVEPLAHKDIFYTKINRFFEKKVIKSLSKRGLFKVGNYYE